jgi:L-threonylcarbamoyladenylate synthase
LLSRGKLVALPTETVYGLAADARDDEAVAKIFSAKARPSFNPLIIHVADLDEARKIAEFDPVALTLARRFWPGPLSLVLKRQARSTISYLATAGLDTIALRVPGNLLARQVIEAAHRPLAAPSANPSGRISPTTAEHVREGLDGKIDAIIDGGPTLIGIESTVITTLDDRPRLLRPGSVTRAEIESVIGPLTAGAATEFVSPGQLKSHYAPEHRLRLGARAIQRDEALLAFGARPLDGAIETLNLSPSGNLAEAAANLFSMLRRLDALPIAGIAVMAIPESGLGEAINDRLRRAAHRER